MKQSTTMSNSSSFFFWFLILGCFDTISKKLLLKGATSSLIPICQALAAQAVHEIIYNNVQLFFILLLVLGSGLFRHHFKETALERCHELPDTYLSSPSCPSCAWNNLQQCPTLLHCSSSSWFWVVSTPFQRNCSWKVPRAPWYLFVKP